VVRVRCIDQRRAAPEHNEHRSCVGVSKIQVTNQRVGSQIRCPAPATWRFSSTPIGATARERFLGELLRGEPIIGATNGYIYTGTAPTTRRIEEYTARIIPNFSGVQVPAKLSLIVWQK
jgi:hypothetical protein